MDRDTFIFRKEWRDAIKDLPDDARLEIYEAVIDYACTGAMPARLSPMAALALNFVRETLDKDGKKYARISDKRRDAINKRWEKEDAAVKASNDNQADTDDTNDTNVCKDSVRTPQNTNVSEKYKCISAQTSPHYDSDNDNDNELSNDNKETANAVKKARAAPLPPLEERTKEFYESLIPFVSRYGKEMVRDFYEYWSEPTQDKHKMRWELQKTWSVQRRLRTWKEKEKQFSQRDGNNRTGNQTAADRAADVAATIARLAAENDFD